MELTIYLEKIYLLESSSLKIPANENCTLFATGLSFLKLFCHNHDTSLIPFFFGNWFQKTQDMKVDGVIIDRIDDLKVTTT